MSINPFLFLVFGLMLFTSDIFAITISPSDANVIAEKIWKNECAGTVEGLTTWNKGEDFPSLGIGHFIWYPEGKHEGFKETFPALLKFLKDEDAVFPEWLKSVQICPWKTKMEFDQKKQSPQMLSLRQFLYETRHLQAIFIAKRLENALPQITEGLSQLEKKHIIMTFDRLSKIPEGLYALIDYLNFKGEGSSATERYQGEGWGLLQVLQKMPATGNPLSEFTASAKEILTQRVKNSPPERNEQRWLKGWLNRVDSYSF